VLTAGAVGKIGAAVGGGKGKCRDARAEVSHRELDEVLKREDGHGDAEARAPWKGKLEEN
jgi:hypothetical protein